MKIPKILHIVSPGGEQLIPSKYKEWFQTWRTILKDWKIIVWDNRMMDTLVEKGFPEYLELYQSLSSFLEKKNIFRLMALYSVGGVYVNIDTKCLKPLENLFEPDTEIAFVDFAGPNKLKKLLLTVGTVKGTYFQDGFMASVERHPFWKYALNNARKYAKVPPLVALSRELTVLYTTGSVFLSMAFKDGGWEMTNGLQIIQRELIDPCYKSSKCSTDKAFILTDREACRKRRTWCIIIAIATLVTGAVGSGTLIAAFLKFNEARRIEQSVE